MSGKGSAPRPFTDRAEYETNFESIFGRRERGPEHTEQDATDGDHLTESSNGE